MLDLIQHYNFITIIEVLILSMLAVKGFISFLEWCFPRLKKVIKRVDEPEILKENLKEQTHEIDEIKEVLQSLIKKIDTLIASDKDDIKAFITREHHYFVYQKGWIDDYSLDCIERRYSHYVDQGGNSFIKGLMMEIRKLPKKVSENELQK